LLFRELFHIRFMVDGRSNGTCLKQSYKQKCDGNAHLWNYALERATLSSMSDFDGEKKLAAIRAVAEIKSGMIVGLGTGSTATFAIRELGRRIREESLEITAAATSRNTATLATSEGIPVVPFEHLSEVDLTIDGADEVTPQLQAIKGGGGALLREKIVATASKRVIIVADSSKLVNTLGRFKLPVEVLPFAASFVERSLKEFGVPLERRKQPDGRPFLTDQGAYIFDLHFGVIKDPGAVAERLSEIPGVLGYGLFLTEIDEVYLGRGSSVEILRREEIGVKPGRKNAR
jgi:ribose 5-phosphate isomerase A